MKGSKSGTEFMLLVNDGIDRCQAYLRKGFELDSGLALEREMLAKFSDHIVDFRSELNRTDELYEMQSVGMYAEAQRNLTDNIETIMYKLIAFRANDYANTKEFPNTNGGVNVQANLTATQTQTVSISFEEVKRKIEDMTGLSEAETKETIEKIDEIKAIVELKEPKKTKWQKIRPILTWLADKSVDVGITVLPLLLKIGG